VDVQQGDGAVIEAPDGKIILVDGGDNQLFARYLAARFRGTSESKPKMIDCILVTHGDADHFAGLTEIHESETNSEPKKRLFIAAKRVYHNGLVKRPSKDENKKTVPEKEMLGPTIVADGETILTGLVDNLLDVPDKRMNLPFRQWKQALAAWNNRSEIEFRRLSFGDDDAFDFFKGDDLEISVLGPFLTKKGAIAGLKFLGNPPKGPRIGHESLELGEEGFKGFSASHTINGHSIVFRLRYGGFSFLFSGDLNDEAGRILARKHQKGEINLRSEVFKVPHHGSADFSGAFFQMVSPIISVVSSGDESAKKEYIHPRATLMGALGRHSRVDEPLIFVTELVAFFNLEGWSRLTDQKKSEKRGEFFAFSRAAYGLVKTRTDGARLLVYTDSGKANMKEAYCYSLDENGLPVPAPVVRV
jgi:beta-lactamase superfamily II metal-dependent hydrolase